VCTFAQRFQSESTVWGSWGQLDANQLARECERHGVPHPLAGFEHVNLKRRFAKDRKIKEVAMARARKMVGHTLEGNVHAGLRLKPLLAARTPSYAEDVVSNSLKLPRPRSALQRRQLLVAAPPVHCHVKKAVIQAPAMPQAQGPFIEKMLTLPALMSR
jgi:hypothetical protein